MADVLPFARTAHTQDVQQHDQEDADEYHDSEEDGDVFLTLDDAPVRIEPGLFIGSMLSEANCRALVAAGITHVVQVRRSHGVPSFQMIP